MVTQTEPTFVWLPHEVRTLDDLEEVGIRLCEDDAGMSLDQDVSIRVELPEGWSEVMNEHMGGNRQIVDERGLPYVVIYDDLKFISDDFSPHADVVTPADYVAGMMVFGDVTFTQIHGDLLTHVEMIAVRDGLRKVRAELLADRKSYEKNVCGLIRIDLLITRLQYYVGAV